MLGSQVIHVASFIIVVRMMNNNNDPFSHMKFSRSIDEKLTINKINVGLTMHVPTSCASSHWKVVCLLGCFFAKFGMVNHQKKVQLCLSSTTLS